MQILLHVSSFHVLIILGGTSYLGSWRKIHVCNIITGMVILVPIVFCKWNITRFEVFTAVTVKNGVFWDVTPCGSCKNRHFGGT
jgi:hypothetical protein